jgi:hypothetical protein
MSPPARLRQPFHHAISLQRDPAQSIATQQKTANIAVFFPAGRSSEGGPLSLEAAFPSPLGQLH